MRPIHATNLGLLLLLWGGSLWAHPRLPGSVPVHFGVSGAPDRWAGPSLLSWFALPVLAAALHLLTYGLARALPSRPGWVNLPRKERFRALPPQRQAPVLVHVRRLLWGAATPALALFCAIQLATWRAAHGRSSEGLVVGALVGAVLTTPVLLALFLPPIERELDRQLRADAAERAAAGRA